MSGHSIRDTECSMGLALSIRDSYLASALSESSNKVYKSGLKTYKKFCAQLSLPLFPLTQTTLEVFVNTLAKKLSHDTIKVYLSGLQFHSIIRGYTEHISSMMRLDYVLRGIRRKASSKPNTTRHPITFSHLELLFTFFETHFCQFDCLMLQAAICVAFFGLLHSAEFTATSPFSWDPSTHLSVPDIKKGPCGTLSLTIKASKTDQFRSGTEVHLGKVNSKFCPVTALKRYLRIRGNIHGPLFLFSDQSFLTRCKLSVFIKECFPNSTNLNTHSFRIGGASAAAQAGVPPLVIQKLGRWKSNCFLRYIHCGSRDMREAQDKINSRYKKSSSSTSKIQNRKGNKSNRT